MSMRCRVWAGGSMGSVVHPLPCGYANAHLRCFALRSDDHQERGEYGPGGRRVRPIRLGLLLDSSGYGG